MPEPILAYLAGTFVGLFIGAVAYAFLSPTSPEDDDESGIDADATDSDDDDTTGAGPFALCAGCGRIAPRDEQMRLCPKCAPPPDAIEDIVSDR